MRRDRPAMMYSTCIEYKLIYSTRSLLKKKFIIYGEKNECPLFPTPILKLPVSVDATAWKASKVHTDK